MVARRYGRAPPIRVVDGSKKHTSSFLPDDERTRWKVRVHRKVPAGKIVDKAHSAKLAWARPASECLGARLHPPLEHLIIAQQDAVSHENLASDSDE